MGKKKAEEMAMQRAHFVDGATQNNVNAHTANQIFDLMEKFSGYGFNRSHSAAYAVITYQTAWLKAHFPAEFMAAVLSSDMDNTDKVVIFIEECKRLKIPVLPPNINQSRYKFHVNTEGSIVYGLGAIKGIGENAIEHIMQARQKITTFTDLFNFCQQIDLRKINRRVLESLIRSGAMDSFGVDRGILMASIDKALQMSEQQSQAKSVGQVDLFGNVLTSSLPAQQYVSAPFYTEEQKLVGEKETLGLYLSGHPISRYLSELGQFVSTRIVELRPQGEKIVRIAGWVVMLKFIMTKSGNRMAILTLDDQSARVEITVFSEAFNTYRDLLVKDQLLIIEGEVNLDEFTGGNRMMARRIFSIDQARNTLAKGLSLQLQQAQLTQNFSTQLMQILKPYCGGKCPVYIHYQNTQAGTQVALGESWKIQPQQKLLESLYELCGREQVMVEY
jgi:DNA polymerase-3 subunit alpha